MTIISEQHSAEASAAIWKTTPPWLAVAADKVFGMNLNDWVMLFALIYTILQIIVLVRNQFLRKRAGNAAE